MKIRFCILGWCLGPVNTLTAEGCLETRPAMHSNIHAFRSESFRKYLSYEAERFFPNVPNFM